MLATPQLRDDTEVEQTPTFLGRRRGQREHVVIKPAGQGRALSGQRASLDIGFARTAPARALPAAVAVVVGQARRE